MGRIIACTGRGGTGKTTFVTLASRFIDLHPLLIDADSDQSLSDMLGVDLQEENIKTISDVLFDIQKHKDKDLDSFPLPEKIEYLVNSECVYESDRFDLISIGVKWTEGCYCAPNSILKNVIPSIARSYEYTIIDSPGGLEHLNRRIISEVDDLFIILDPSKKSLKNVERVKKISNEIGIVFKNIYLVANHRFTPEAEKYIKTLNDPYLGKIEYDKSLEEFIWSGKSLFDLPDDSPTYQSIRNILLKAGLIAKVHNI